ncbi:hypothetical protein [Sphingomonas psychrotolerans]|uniref:Uncharacterized protein n=1 Tax=Sphingomonas psychrotolerans TaxID=1327635 RepID=A0A2K8MEX6_9SPHN|nr:hypothetical protein [Sphingomonas psychrotolerans]ATY32438.1 hypothetical protein CVN68_10995 [Sphingomonas psychrotolerans]
MLRRAALLLAPLALAGCGGAPSQDGAALQKHEQARAADLAKVTGWARAFQPDVAVAGANQFGFHAPAYAAAKQGFISVGTPVMVTDTAAKKPNSVGFAAMGKTAERIDTLAFDLMLTDAPSAGLAHKRFADIVRDFLFQSKIDSKPIHDKIAKGEAGKGQLDGIDYAIEKAADRLTVTFHRTGASAPANR